MSPSNEHEIADIRRTLAMLAERVVRLERKVMGRTLMEVFTENDEDEEGRHCELCRLTKDWDRQWMGVYAEDERFPSQLSVLPYEDDHENDGVSCSGLLDSCPCFECRTWREDHE